MADSSTGRPWDPVVAPWHLDEHPARQSTRHRPGTLDATSLETPRLLLRRWRSDDLDGFAAVNAQPEVMRYIHDGRTLDRAATAERLAKRTGDTSQGSA